MGRRYSRLLALGCMVGASLCVLLATPNAAADVSGVMSFQGKLTNPDGTNVADGSYSIRFRIYTDPSADAASSCLPAFNTCKWEETHGSVSVSGGLFHVNLGSAGSTLPGSVDFNSTSLYLGVKVTSDSEMTPRILLTTSPQAFNSDQLDGLDSTNFLQLSPGTLQRSAGGTTTLDLTDGANTALNVTNSGAGAALINADGYQIGGTSGLSATCASGQFLQGQVTSGALSPVGAVAACRYAASWIARPMPWLTITPPATGTIPQKTITPGPTSARALQTKRFSVF